MNIIIIFCFFFFFVSKFSSVNRYNIIRSSSYSRLITHGRSILRKRRAFDNVVFASSLRFVFLFLKKMYTYVQNPNHTKNFGMKQNVLTEGNVLSDLLMLG